MAAQSTKHKASSGALPEHPLLASLLACLLPACNQQQQHADTPCTLPGSLQQASSQISLADLAVLASQRYNDNDNDNDASIDAGNAIAPSLEWQALSFVGERAAANLLSMHKEGREGICTGAACLVRIRSLRQHAMLGFRLEILVELDFASTCRLVEHRGGRWLEAESAREEVGVAALVGLADNFVVVALVNPLHEGLGVEEFLLVYELLELCLESVVLGLGLVQLDEDV
eukprot:CAMPEP_0206501672 /NCGR_PEP_ID=MMETSP0324_2-20121206/53466_1 /ASSEMBLY_ACC=CAM_ASM_000836 /TAXON_ID=2866 /ORGANISM="Crypthecodinium cohnii, Strain Seligo" /LENGTH=229 /DNA_ID=CAMNT_0053989569 /DNA_START=209 /DNA_END=895 /DNA_ORIENTATION=-